MAKTVLSLRELNRTLLARQLLLDRAPINALDAVRRVVALQSQIPNPPYIGLWTRLTHFQRADLTRLLEERHVVRAAFLRSTLHVVAAADHHHFRPVIAPAFLKALKGFFGKRTAGIDSDHVVAVARPFLLEQPRTMGEIEAFLLTHYPDADSAALGYTLRTHLPLVQIPPAGTWGAGTKAVYTTADHWLGADTPPADIKTLFARYLRAFGPASIMDFQTWTGMTNLKQALEPHLAEFVMYQDEQGRVLFDVPDQPIEAATSPAPVRFIPEYDNLLIAHANRNRVLPDEHRSQVLLSAGRIASTILVDGFVAGTWKINKTRQAATLTIKPFAPLNASDRAAVLAEGERLVRFVEDTAAEHTVLIT